MAAKKLAVCPGCKKVVKVPEDAGNVALKCKHCGMVSQMKTRAEKVAQSVAVGALPAKAQVSAQATLPEVTVTHPQPITETPVPRNTSMLPVPVAPPVPAAAGWEGLNDDPTGEADAPTVGSVGRHKYRRSRSRTPIIAAVAILMLCIGGALAATLIAPKIKKEIREQEANKEKTTHTTAPAVAFTPQAPLNTPTNASGTPKKNEQPEIPEVHSKYPRRLLGVCVSNYLYANPVAYGGRTSRTSHDFGAVLKRLSEKLHIDRSQVYELSDGAKPVRQPIKKVIELTIQQFMETCRPQDRIIFILTGHALEIDGKAYIAPIEGDLEDQRGLIELKWVMDQLAACKAQQKVFLADFNRFQSVAGETRPSGGKMAPKIEEMLKHPPAGVQVWSACSAGQYSYEYDDATYNRMALNGGLLLNEFFYAFQTGGEGIQKPEDPLPIERLAKKVNEDVAKAVQDIEHAEQTPFLAGEPKAEAVAYNAEEPLPKMFEVPTPDKAFEKGVVSANEIRDILREIEIPTIKVEKEKDVGFQFDKVLPFSGDVMDKFKLDKSIEEIKKEIENKPDKYPLRIAVINAVEGLRELRNSEAGEKDLPDTYDKAQDNDARKAAFKKLQESPARVMAKLRDLHDDLEKAGEDRKDEKSKRWQAHYDYILAQVKFRLAYMNEFSLMVGKIRKSELPELAEGQTGWKISASDNMSSSTEFKDMVRDAKKLLAKIIKDYPGTPWEVLAKRDKKISLGLKWVPIGGGGPDEMPAMSKEKEK
jgi:hypothetical protein